MVKSFLELLTFKKKDLEAAITNLQRSQEECSHPGDQVSRIGPSYTRGLDGSFIKFDSYFCMGCGLSTNLPIGPYKNQIETGLYYFIHNLD